MRSLRRLSKFAAVIATCLIIGGCDNVGVYGSVGYSSYGGYGGMRTSVGVGGRIY